MKCKVNPERKRGLNLTREENKALYVYNELNRQMRAHISYAQNKGMENQWNYYITLDLLNLYCCVTIDITEFIDDIVIDILNSVNEMVKEAYLL